LRSACRRPSCRPSCPGLEGRDTDFRPARELAAIFTIPRAQQPCHAIRRHVGQGRAPASLPAFAGELVRAAVPATVHARTIEPRRHAPSKHDLMQVTLERCCTLCYASFDSSEDRHVRQFRLPYPIRVTGASASAARPRSRRPRLPAFRGAFPGSSYERRREQTGDLYRLLHRRRVRSAGSVQGSIRRANEVIEETRDHAAPGSARFSPLHEFRDDTIRTTT
jgi:hypothetical protein